MKVEDVKSILEFPAFITYNETQRAELERLLSQSTLSPMQVDTLFGSTSTGGIICFLVEDSKIDDSAAKRLYNIINNMSERVHDSFGPTSCIYNLIGRLGPYHEQIEHDVINITQNHVRICGGRIVDPFLPEELSGLITAEIFRNLPGPIKQIVIQNPITVKKMIVELGFNLDKMHYVNKASLLYFIKYNDVLSPLVTRLKLSLESLLELDIDNLKQFNKALYRDLHGDDSNYGYLVLRRLLYPTAEASEAIHLIANHVQQQFETQHPRLLDSLTVDNFFETIRHLKRTEIVFIWEKMKDSQDLIISTIKNSSDLLRLGNALAHDFDGRGRYTVFPEFRRKIFDSGIVFTSMNNFEDYKQLNEALFWNGDEGHLYHNILRRHVQNNLSNLLQDTKTAIKDFEIVPILAGIDSSAYRKIIQENKQKLFDIFELKYGLRWIIRNGSSAKNNYQVLLMPSKTTRHYYSEPPQKIVLEKLLAGVSFIPEKTVYYPPFPLQLNEEELSRLTFPSEGEEPSTIEYHQDPALCRSIFQQCPDGCKELDTEQLKILVEELVPDNFPTHFETDDLKSLPSDVAIIFVKKLNFDTLFSSLPKLLKLDQFNETTNAVYRKELLSHFFNFPEFPYQKSGFPRSIKHFSADMALLIFKKIDETLLLNNVQLIFALSQFDSLSNPGAFEALKAFYLKLPWQINHPQLPHFLTFLSGDEKKELLHLIQENKKISLETWKAGELTPDVLEKLKINGLLFIVNCLEILWNNPNDHENQTKLANCIQKNNYSLEEDVFPWLQSPIESEKIVSLVTALLKNEIKIDKDNFEYQFPKNYFENPIYRTYFEKAKQELCIQIEKNKVDPFTLALNNKINYYLQRRDFFLNKNYSENSEKWILYYQIEAIFIRERAQYIVNNNDSNTEGCKRQCLDNIKHQVENLEVSLKINQSRNIIAKALRFIRAIAEFFGLVEPVDTAISKVKVVDNLSFFSQKSTQTAKDLVEIVTSLDLQKPS